MIALCYYQSSQCLFPLILLHLHQVRHAIFEVYSAIFYLHYTVLFSRTKSFFLNCLIKLTPKYTTNNLEKALQHYCFKMIMLLTLSAVNFPFFHYVNRLKINENNWNVFIESLRLEKENPMFYNLIMITISK